MSFKITNIKKIAKLSGLDYNEFILKNKNDNDVINKLNKILNKIKEIQKINTSNTIQMAHPLNISQTLRNDTVDNKKHSNQIKKIIPKQMEKLGFYLVPKVINK